jgi:hypothetical protein
MNRKTSVIVALLAACLAALFAAGAQSNTGVLTSDQVKSLVPTSYFFAGKKAPVQVRNSVGFQQSGKNVLAGFVDTTGYASNIRQKYQGFLITEIKLGIGGSDLPPGEYGFGFTKDNKFIVMDTAANDLLSADAQFDKQQRHPVPLQFRAADGNFRLYEGRQWVEIKPE